MSAGTLPDDGTIAARATAPGVGAIGIIRLSGGQVRKLGAAILRRQLPPRQALYGPFHGQAGILDRGIALFFPAPHSYTGEDMLELQGHGGPVVMDLILEELLRLGARPAQPGEFSLRAYLNGKMDLSQAEAVSDLIGSASRQAARASLRSLEGAFSSAVRRFNQELLQLRVQVEAAIDFPEEEIDFLNDGRILGLVDELRRQLQDIRRRAGQGKALREGLRIAITGRPNAGKSSLLNRLAGHERAIVSPQAGTTRDTLDERILVDGIPLQLVDTAGLRQRQDPVEAEGMRRTLREVEQADRVLLGVDSSREDKTDAMRLWPEEAGPPPDREQLTLVRNKIDLSGLAPGPVASASPAVIQLSAKSGQGLEALRTHLKECAGHTGREDEGVFMARRRHLDALDQANAFLEEGRRRLVEEQAGELLAEELRRASDALGAILGRTSSDELLGMIFSEFCIGK